MSKVQKSNLLIITCVFTPILGAIFLSGVPSKITLALNQYLFILIPCIIFMVANKMDIKKTLKLNPMKISDVFKVILLTVVMLPITLFISTIGSMIFTSPITEFMNDIVSSNTFPYLFFVIAITPAICEEVIMRGIVLDGYKKFGFKKAVILNGILFGMLHMNFHQFFYTAFLGIVFAMVVWYTKSIFASMLMHLVNNGLSVAMSFIAKTNQETINQAEDLTASPVNTIMYVVIIIISLYLTYYILKSIKLNNLPVSEMNYNKPENLELEANTVTIDSFEEPSKPYDNQDNAFEEENISHDLNREYDRDKNVGILNASFICLTIIFIGISLLTQFMKV